MELSRTGGAAACRLQEFWGMRKAHGEACLGRSRVGSGSDLVDSTDGVGQELEIHVKIGGAL